MEKQTLNPTAKKIIAAVCIVLLAGLLIGSYFLWIKPKAEQGEKAVGLSIEFAGKRADYVGEHRTDGNTVFEFLNERKDALKFEYEEGIFGAYVTSFLGVNVNDLSGNYYWAFYINDAYSDFGISEQTIKDGDKIKFVIETW